MNESTGVRVRNREDGVIVRWAGNELLLLDTAADRIHQLNPTAGLIWEKLATGDSSDDIVRALCDQFDVSEDQARADVAQTLCQFREQGLVA